jgi:hypothetical protein
MQLVQRNRGLNANASLRIYCHRIALPQHRNNATGALGFCNHFVLDCARGV